MDMLIIALLLLGGILFLLAELFLIPGTSLASLVAAGFNIYAIYFAFTSLGTLGGCITLILALALSAISVVLFMRSKTLEKISLKKDIEGSVQPDTFQKIQVGDEGIAVTRLCLMGNAQFGNEILEVKSADGFIEVKTPVRVVRKTSDTIVVEAIR